MIRNQKTTPPRRTQGSKWIRRSTRLAIYLRDGESCTWCGSAVEDGASLTLDHIRPYSRGGSHHASNLITACAACNTARGARSAAAYAAACHLTTTGQTTADAVTTAIRRQTRRNLDRYRAQALAILQRRSK